MSDVRCIDTHPRFRHVRSPPIAPESAAFAAAFGLVVDPHAPRVFSFIRRRVETEVWLRQGAFSSNLTHYEGATGMRFKAARRWARVFAAAYGFIYREEKR